MGSLSSPLPSACVRRLAGSHQERGVKSSSAREKLSLPCTDVSQAHPSSPPLTSRQAPASSLLQMCDKGDLLSSHVACACPCLHPLLSLLLSPLHTLFSSPGSEAQVPRGCAQLGCPGDAQDDLGRSSTGHTYTVCPEKDHCVTVWYRNGFGVTSEGSFVTFEAWRARMGVFS